MANLELPGPLVSVAWLRQQLGHEDLVIFDASWHMPATGRDGFKEWQDEHIPGARFFDFDAKICDPDSSLPHMMPDEEIFTREVRALGLNQDSCVVVYDAMGMFSSPRAWWMLRAMGCEKLALLDGGLVAWDEADYPIESCQVAPSYASGDFSARLDASQVADAGAVLAALDDDSVCVLDARPMPRFRGSSEEPRPGLLCGHMPGALNQPFPELFHHGLFRSKAELEQMLKPLVGDCNMSICSCGSGVTACIIAFALHYIGDDRFSVYDGSWCEWGLPERGLPVVVDDD